MRNSFTGYVLSLFGLLSALLLGLGSCGVDRWPEYYPRTGRDLWIDSVMREDYLWYEEIPSSESLNYFQEPEQFLSSLLSASDHYSSVDTIYASLPPAYGFDYSLYATEEDTVYNALVTYVIPGSPAEEAGLRRGDWIMQVDTIRLMRDNSEELLSAGGPRRLLLGRYVSLGEDEYGEAIGGVVADREVDLPSARGVTDVVVPCHSVFSQDGYTIGYLVYNSFSADADEQLRQLFRDFANQGVGDLVLDLRYNEGGTSGSLQLLASLLAPSDAQGRVLASLQYNRKKADRNRDILLDTQNTGGGVNLGLSTLYVLTSEATAAASEMLVNGLRPYMEVVVIGETTAGDVVATADYTNPRYPWVLRPAVCFVYNAEGQADYASGIRPDYSVGQFDNLADVLPLGDPGEALLKAAIEYVLGQAPVRQAVSPVSRPFAGEKKLRRNFRKGLIVPANP